MIGAKQRGRLALDQRAHIHAMPLRFGQETVRGRHRLDPSPEIMQEFRDARRVTSSLPLASACTIAREFLTRWVSSPLRSIPKLVVSAPIRNISVALDNDALFVEVEQLLATIDPHGRAVLGQMTQFAAPEACLSQRRRDLRLVVRKLRFQKLVAFFKSASSRVYPKSATQPVFQRSILSSASRTKIASCDRSIRRAFFSRR